MDARQRLQRKNFMDNVLADNMTHRILCGLGAPLPEGAPACFAITPRTPVCYKGEIVGQVESADDHRMIIELATPAELLKELSEFQKELQEKLHNVLGIPSALMNPLLAGRYFTQQDILDWQPDYYTRWNGCNVPPRVFRPFLDLFAPHLSKQEKSLLPFLESGKYLVGVHRQSPNKDHTIIHEAAHALYDGCALYKNTADDFIRQLRPTIVQSVTTKLQQMGYGQHVIDDEIQAYMVSGWYKLDLTLTPQEQQEVDHISNELRAVLKKWYGA